MNTIKIFLAESGRVADMHKDFPLYQGQFNDKLLNIFVPTSILAPHFDVQHYIGKASGVDLPTTAFLDEFVASHTEPSREPQEGDTIGFVKVLTEYTQDYYLYTFDGEEWDSEQVDSLGTVNDIAGTSVKLAVVVTERDGKIYKSKNYYMRYLKTMNCQGLECALYERKLPKEFTTFVGEGENAPVMLFNVVDVNTKQDTILSVVTSQSCHLDVMPSSDLDQDPEEEVGELDALWAVVNQHTGEILAKQDKYDTSLNTQSKMVVGAINEIALQNTNNTSDISNLQDEVTNIKGDIEDIQIEQGTQNENINANTEKINENTSDIADLKAIVGTGEHYITTITWNKNPINPDDRPAIIQALHDAVRRLTGRDEQGGDVIIYVASITGATDKTFKYIYSGAINEETGEPIGWTFYEIPTIERASNTDRGILKGNYNASDTTHKIQVNVVSGDIEDVYLVNNRDEHVRLGQYLNSGEQTITNLELQVGANTTNIGTLNGKVGTLETTTGNILSGATQVGSAAKADADGLNRNIAETYMTQTAGVTKTQMREYALPRAFNDVSYLTSTGYSDTIPDTSSPVYTATSTSVGDTELFSAEKTIANANFELSSKNSSTDTIYVSASEVCNVQFRLTTEVYTDNAWTTASIELTDAVQYATAGEIKKISFGSTFAHLDEVLSVTDNDKIRQTLEVVTNTSESITFDVYSNTTYPSTFYLNTTSQTIYVAQGDLGEVLTITLTGTYDSVEDTVTFDIPEGLMINDSVMAQFILTLPTVTAPDELTDATKVAFTQGTQDIITLVVPTLADNRTVPIIKDMSSTIADTLMLFKGVFEVDNGDIYLYTDITVGGDELPTNLVTTDTDQIIEGKKTIKDTSLDFQNSNASGNASWQLEPDQYGQLGLYRTYNNIKSKMIEFNGNSIKPVGSNGNLGSATQKWANVYADNLNDGTNSIAIGNIANKNNIGFSIIPTPASTTLTDDEKNAIKSGGIVNGNISGLGQYQNYVFYPSGDLYSGYYMGFLVVSRNGYSRLYQYAINDSTNVLTFYGNKYIDIDSASNISISGLNSINAKTIPAYPSDTTKNYVLQQDKTTGALSWNEVNGDIVDTGSDQSIEGQKTFLSQLRVKRPADGGGYFYVSPDGNGYNIKMGFSSGGQMMIHNGGFQVDRNFTPMTANSNLDLGTSSIMWRDLHLKGVLNDGTNSVSVADIKDIQDVIPAQASSSNQLADKDFVNSSVQTATANFRGNWATWTAVPSVATDYPEDFAGSKTPTVNDYLVVQNASDYTGQTLEGTWRFKYTGDWATNGKSGWMPEYQVNETPLTAAQLAALNSGITSTSVAQIGTNTSNIALKQNSTDNTLATDDKTIVGSINEIVEAVGSLGQDVEDGFTAIAGELNGKQAISNLVTSLSSSSTDAQYPSAKCVYDLVGDVETLLTELNSGQGV